MVKALFGAIALLGAGQSLALDWQRPDCSRYDLESQCINAYKNAVRMERQSELREAGIQFWYYERPDFSDNENIEKAFEDKLEGALLVSFNIEKDGSVSGVALKDQTSEEVLVYAEPVLAAVKNWQFVPIETAVRGKDWLFPFIFKEDPCDEGKDTEDCKDGDVPQGPKGPGAQVTFYGPQWSGPLYDLFFIDTP